MLLNSSSYAQSIFPDEAVDKEKVSECQKVVGEINSMPLKCNTISIKPFTQSPTYYFEGIFFDEQGRLRKYYWEQIMNDGASEEGTTTAYYDKNGKLVYIFLENSSNCEWSREYYYINNGFIVDFKGALYCECCEEGEEESAVEGVDFIRPIIGAPLTMTMERYPLTDFIHANTLLKAMQQKKEENEYNVFNTYEIDF